MSDARATGRCLCGAVTYDIRGPLRDIFVCHCVECRRWGGSAIAFSATRAEDLVVHETDALRWIGSPESDRDARRAFCSQCGSSLSWQAAGAERIGIAEVLDDGLPRDPDRSTVEIRWS